MLHAPGQGPVREDTAPEPVRKQARSGRKRARQGPGLGRGARPRRGGPDPLPPSGAMGSEPSDAEFYGRARLEGGLAYTPEALRWIFDGFTEVELRRMNDEPEGSGSFGEAFLWTALFRRPE